MGKKVLSALSNLILILLCCTVLSACSSNNAVIEKKICLEADCNEEALDSDYCPDHNVVYEHEREFYSDVQRITSAFKDEFGYSVTQNYGMKEIVIKYQKPTDAGKEEHNLSDYVLEYYIYYELNGKAQFAKYCEWYRLCGVTPSIESCDESIFTFYRKLALGGADSLYKNQLRTNHYCTDNVLNIYEYDEIFIVNFDDYVKQGYSL